MRSRDAGPAHGPSNVRLDERAKAPRDEVEAAAAGDREAFGRLAERHARLVRSVVLSQIRRREDAGDCVQEAFARALRDIGRLRDPCRFTPWLLTVARNVAIDHRRSWLRELDHVSTGDDDSLGQLTAEDPAPDDIAAARSLASTLRAAVEVLPEREAAALVLVTDFDLGPAGVAGALDTTPGNAKVIVHRARRRLREALVLAS